jgi:enoyl-CoA hydratase
MDYSFLRFETSDAVGVLTLNRPEKRNALSIALRAEIVGCLDEAAASQAVRAVVITGAGPAFCAGFDRSEFDQAGIEALFQKSTAYHRRVHRFEKPLVAAVNGPAMGGGCDLAAMCDFRVAATAASFGQPQVRFGAPAVYDLMRDVVGTGVAREMCLTGRSYDAREALSIGLVNRVVEPSALLETARALALEVAALPEGLAEALKRGFVASQPPLFEGS